MDRRDDTVDERAAPTDPGLGPAAPKDTDTQRMATTDALAEAFGKARPAPVEHVASEGLDAARWYAGPREVPSAHTDERDRPLVEIVPTNPPVREEVPPIQTPDPGTSRRDVTTAVPQRSVWPWATAGVLAALLVVLLVWLHGRTSETTPASSATATTSAPAPLPTPTISPSPSATATTPVPTTTPTITAPPPTNTTPTARPTATAKPPPSATATMSAPVATANPPPTSSSPLFTGHE